VSADLRLGDCLEVMATLPAGSVDLVLADLPYGTTACAWDAVIPFDALWAQFRRLLRPGGAVVLTAAQPFTTAVIASNLADFKYCWYWDKKAVTGFANAKLQPLRCIEDVVVFYASRPTYNPQGLVHLGKTRANSATVGGDTVRTDTVASSGKGSLRTAGAEYVQEWTNYPKQLLEISRDRQKVHPTQKPVALMEYLIRTYTNPNQVVLDCTMGSGTTGVAALQSQRHFIGIERDPVYFAIAQGRIAAASPPRPRIVIDLAAFRRETVLQPHFDALQARLAARG
jgi:site-specific DNA-methyltransferase (adenine-specific)